MDYKAEGACDGIWSDGTQNHAQGDTEETALDRLRLVMGTCLLYTSPSPRD